MLRGLLLLAAAALPPSAEAAEPPWHGVWQGTIGSLPVRVCLQQRGGEFSNGSYYYVRQMKPIALEHQDDGSWTERADSDAVTGTWKITAAGARLTGQWRGAKTALPVSLARVPVADGEEDPCGSDEYIAPRVRPVRVTMKRAKAKGFAFTELTYVVGPSFPDVSIVSFSYPATRPGDAAINAALRIDPAKKEGDADYLGCMRGQLGSNGVDGDFAMSYAPALVTPEFISIAANVGGDCGGAHPSESLWHLTFDRVSGRKVALARWFTARGVVPGDPAAAQLAPALKALALKHFPFEQGADADCREAVTMSDYWDLAVDRRGIAFEPSLPHVAQACGATSVVPFAELAPLLSAEGRAGVARLGR
jgi:hypothetical protein